MSRSHELFQRACRVIPGGVNSPVRACRSVGCEPLFIVSGKGAYITDADGTTYVDYVQSWGPLLLGHAHSAVTRAVVEAAALGTSFGAPCEAEVVLAEMVLEALPNMEMVRMVNSGTEAAMSALRLARGVTGRAKVIKFDGGYHGHGDAFLAAAGSGVATLSIPGTPGVPDAVVADTLLAPYNDLDALRALFERFGKDIAAVIVEPAAGNMGLILPEPGFLQGLRDLCTQAGSLLIMDEVITGFRASYNGAQGRFGLDPDVTVLGKIIGGGLPVGAYAGKRRYMEQIAPLGGIYQAGTLSGNPLAMAAGIAGLKVLKEADYAGLEKRVEELCADLENIFRAKGIDVTVNRLASMFTIFFRHGAVRNFAEAKASDVERWARFYRHARAAGVNMAPSAFEVSMVSFAHGTEDFNALRRAAETFAG